MLGDLWPRGREALSFLEFTFSLLLSLQLQISAGSIKLALLICSEIQGDGSSKRSPVVQLVHLNVTGSGLEMLADLTLRSLLILIIGYRSKCPEFESNHRAK